MAIQKITAWSYSRWQTYEQCPLKAKLKFIDKKQEPSSPPMERGTAIHKMAEDYVKGVVKKLPVELKLLASQFKTLAKFKASAEEQWCFNSKWENADWFGSDAWLRIKVDAIDHRPKDKIAIIDHKTGREKDDHTDQLSLYAMGSFLKYEEVEIVTAQLWYLDSGNIKEETFKREDLLKLKREWIKKTKPMLNDTTFAPKPSNACRWCHFRKENGGPCKF